MFSARVDHFPLVLSFVRDELSPADVDEIERFFADTYARGERFALLADARGARLPKREVRARLREISQRFAPERERLLIGTAVVVNSAVVAGTIGAVRWWSNREAPVSFFTSAAAACSWLEERERALVVSSAARQVLAELDAAHRGGERPTRDAS